MTDFKQYNLPSIETNSPFEQVGDSFVLKNDIISQDYIQNQQGIKLSATDNQIPYSKIIDDSGTKPDDNATVGATAGTDLKDSSATVLTDTDVKNVDTYELGESFNAYDVGCMKNIPNTSLVAIVDDTFVNSGTAATNYGTATVMYIGNAEGDTQYAFIKIPTTGSPPSHKLMKVELLLYIEGGSYTGTKELTITRADASWDESTINWNTKPGIIDNIDTVYYTTKTKSFSSADPGSYVSLDITQLYKYWLNSDIDNHGLRITMNSASGQYVQITSSDAASNKPLLRITAYDYSDSKIYKASPEDYNLCRTMVGLITESGSTGSSKKFQKFGRINIGGSGPGKRYYLNTTGALVSGNIGSGPDRMIMIGKDATPTGADIELSIQETDIFIEAITIPSGGVTTNLKWYSQGDAKRCLVAVGASATSGGGNYYGILEITKSRSQTVYFPSSASVSAGWDSARNYVIVSGSGTSEVRIYQVDFYN